MESNIKKRRGHKSPLLLWDRGRSPSATLRLWIPAFAHKRQFYIYLSKPTAETAALRVVEKPTIKTQAL